MGVFKFLTSKLIHAPVKAEGDYGTLVDLAEWRRGGGLLNVGQQQAMKIAAVNACVDAITNSISKLPLFVMDGRTKAHADHSLVSLLALRPNEAMNAQTFRKLLEARRLLHGNAYALPIRSASSARVTEILPLPTETMTPAIDDNGALWYLFTNPKTGERRKFRSWDVLHFKAYSEDGITGISVLSRAAEVIRTARSQQAYERQFYDQNAQPSGILSFSNAELNPKAKEKVKTEWERVHAGADGAFRLAVLDMNVQYTPVGMNHADAQFAESKTISVEDIARFFGVPLYKLQAGKQSYSSNEQNAIEYVASTLHPIVTQYEQEYSYKLLFDSELRRSLEIKINLNAELRGDFAARSAFYKALREIGVLSANDIRGLEDLPAVEGGDGYYASLNYVPLSRWNELSGRRAGNGGENNV